MLPGVELARKRRMHNRLDGWARPPEPSPSARLPLSHRPSPSTAMGESALAARLRLAEKLQSMHGSHRPPTSSPSSSSSSSSSSTACGAAGRSVALGSAADAQESSRSGEALQRSRSRVEVCAVCLEEVQAQQRVTWLPCAHKYHTECLLPWLAARSQCPCCRTHVAALPLLS
ncbi:E3 ubiquitin-protein ligase RDUF2-like [Zingiber officinale]|uniref:RING-type domain-containing protein n=1 Tax=Zingiber officinale TaxID=94328 RepID=A0A8J5BFU2_ZINOF|nr:E3 ubiquitin-protein ligase RDUF2-like [Zingiber officinale]KAG6471346.1 hypothetical protein ZIOFF_068787 [Zingiber officinale]